MLSAEFGDERFAVSDRYGAFPDNSIKIGFNLLEKILLFITDNQ
ncbi:hypothetical protein [Tolypothrix sp. FACHB-123]|nr:hypothetical protein [Tolypothrix sp. FACHB-123]